MRFFIAFRLLSDCFPTDFGRILTRIAGVLGSYVATAKVGMLGEPVRCAGDYAARSCGRVRKGMQFHALDTLVRRRTDNFPPPEDGATSINLLFFSTVFQWFSFGFPLKTEKLQVRALHDTSRTRGSPRYGSRSTT